MNNNNTLQKRSNACRRERRIYNRIIAVMGAALILAVGMLIYTWAHFSYMGAQNREFADKLHDYQKYITELENNIMTMNGEADNGNQN